MNRWVTSMNVHKSDKRLKLSNQQPSKSGFNYFPLRTELLAGLVPTVIVTTANF